MLKFSRNCVKILFLRDRRRSVIDVLCRLLIRLQVKHKIEILHHFDNSTCGYPYRGYLLGVINCMQVFFINGPKKTRGSKKGKETEIVKAGCRANTNCLILSWTLVFEPWPMAALLFHEYRQKKLIYHKKLYEITNPVHQPYSPPMC